MNEAKSPLNFKSRRTVAKAPDSLLKQKYRGCGTGFVELSPDSTLDNLIVLNFGYLDQNDNEMNRQNILMSDRAGEKIICTAESWIYRCNFSATDICLF
jgi:hypothetical protein